MTERGWMKPIVDSAEADVAKWPEWQRKGLAAPRTPENNRVPFVNDGTKPCSACGDGDTEQKYHVHVSPRTPEVTLREQIEQAPVYPDEKLAELSKAVDEAVSRVRTPEEEARLHITTEALGNGDWAVVVWDGTEKIEDHIFKSRTAEEVATGNRAKGFAAAYLRERRG